jgi:hypothetical protein
MSEDQKWELRGGCLTGLPPEVAEELELDLNVYGNAFVEHAEGGPWRRIDPPNLIHIRRTGNQENVIGKDGKAKVYGEPLPLPLKEEPDGGS